MRDTFKGNSNDPLLIHAVTRTESKFNRYSYGFGVKTEDRDSAIHMQVKAKLKAGVTDDQVKRGLCISSCWYIWTYYKPSIYIHFRKRCKVNQNIQIIQTNQYNQP